MEYQTEYASKGVGTAGLTTGIIGTALGAVSSGLLSGVLGNNNNGGYVSKETFDVQLQLIDSQKQNSIFSSELNTEKKMVEVYEGMNTKVNNIRDELQGQIRNLENVVNANASAQAVINCGFQSNIGILQTQMNQVMSMTKLMIPNTNVYTPST